MKKIISVLLALMLALCLFAGCGENKTYDLDVLDISSQSSSNDASQQASAGESKKTSGELDGYTYYESEVKTDYVKIEMKNGDLMILKLRPDEAPITVENFCKLVKNKFYDGLKFHRVSKEFVIQGGDPKGNGTGGSDEKIKGEFSVNGVENNIKHVKGVISMARSNDYDSASSQFFIVTQTSERNSASLDGQYAAFGMMIAGWDTLDAIASVKTDSKTEAPLKEQKINTVRFVTVSSAVESGAEN